MGMSTARVKVVNSLVSGLISFLIVITTTASSPSYAGGVPANPNLSQTMNTPTQVKSASKPQAATLSLEAAEKVLVGSHKVDTNDVSIYQMKMKMFNSAMTVFNVFYGVKTARPDGQRSITFLRRAVAVTRDGSVGLTIYGSNQVSDLEALAVYGKETKKNELDGISFEKITVRYTKKVTNRNEETFSGVRYLDSRGNVLATIDFVKRVRTKPGEPRQYLLPEATYKTVEDAIVASIKKMSGETVSVDQIIDVQEDKKTPRAQFFGCSAPPGGDGLGGGGAPGFCRFPIVFGINKHINNHMGPGTSTTTTFYKGIWTYPDDGSYNLVSNITIVGSRYTFQTQSAIFSAHPEDPLSPQISVEVSVDQDASGKLTRLVVHALGSTDTKAFDDVLTFGGFGDEAVNQEIVAEHEAERNAILEKGYVSVGWYDSGAPPPEGYSVEYFVRPSSEEVWPLPPRS